MTQGQEILEAAVASRSEAQPLIRRAIKHFREARRATIQVMADLRILMDGEVHKLYGETNFAIWAEKTFEGLAAGNVRQLTRAGAVALELDKRGLIDLDKPEGIGTTALRELSVLANDFGNERMVEIARTAFEMVKDEKQEVSATTIKAAMMLLMPPANPELDVPDSLPEEGEDPEEDGDDDEERHPPKVRELIDRIQDLSWDLPDTTDELREATEQLQAELKGEGNEADEKWIESKR